MSRRQRNRVGTVFGASLLSSCDGGVCYTSPLPLGDTVYTQAEALKHIEQQLQKTKNGKQQPSTTLANILTILDQTMLAAGKD